MIQRPYLHQEELVQRLLGQDYLDLSIQHIQLSESATYSQDNDREGQSPVHHYAMDSLQQPCHLQVTLVQQARDESHQLTQKSFEISGQGVGFVDAGYEALMQHYVQEYSSLKTLTFKSFEFKSQLASTQKNGSDAICSVHLVVENSDKRNFEFEAQGRSMAWVSLTAVLLAVEYFINSERAFIAVYHSLKHAQQRGRADVIQEKTAQLADLVKTASYTEVIAQIKREMGWN